jgi:hypothetical protein
VKTNLVFVPALLVSLWHLQTAGSDSLVWNLRLDDVNAIGYDHEHPQNSRGLHGLSECNADAASRLLDRIGEMPDTSGSWSITATGQAGSEAGDPLLNKYQDPTLANRDHVTRGLVAAHKGMYGIGGIMEYDDLYSGRFDRIRDVSTPGVEKTSYGLLEEKTAAARISSAQAGWTGTLSQYRRWHLTPLFFSPLYAEGINSVHEAWIDADRAHLSVTGSFDFKERYETSNAPIRRNYAFVEAAGSHEITDSLDAIAFVRHRSETTPHTMAKGGCDWHTRFGVLSPWCGMYENGKSFAGILVAAPLAPVAHVEASIEERYDPAEEPFCFLRADDTVTYRPQEASYTAGHVAGAVERATGRYAATTRIWYDFQSKHKLEAWDSVAPNKITATCRTIDNSASGCGASFSSTLHFGVWQVSGSAAGHMHSGTVAPSLYVPWNWRLNVRYGNPRTDSVAASIDFEGNGPVRYSAIVNRVTQTWSVSPRTAVSFSLRIPFKLPWLGDRMKSAFLLDTGPFCFAPEAAASQHPFGNPIGPCVSIRFDLLLCGR